MCRIDRSFAFILRRRYRSDFCISNFQGPADAAFAFREMRAPCSRNSSPSCPPQRYARPLFGQLSCRI